MESKKIYPAYCIIRYILNASQLFALIFSAVQFSAAQCSAVGLLEELLASV